MKTNYIGHDRAYQRKKNDPSYVGWITHDDLAEELQQTWHPLTQKSAFPKTGRLLELGCGAGNVGIYLAQRGYEVVGVDIAPTAIAWAISNVAQAEVQATFFESDVLTLAEIESESFDIALDSRCLHCIIGEDRDRFLQAAHRILKPSGILTVCSMCNQVPDTPYFREHFDPQSCCTIHDGIATRYIGDSNEILKTVMQAGFRILSIEVIPPRHPEDLADLQAIAAKI